MQCSWGLKFKLEAGTPRIIIHTFTVPESETIIRAVKSRLGPTYTISHLGHAAVVLALLKSSPPSHDIPDSQSFTMTLGNIKSFKVDDNDKDAVVEALERGCKIAKESYDQWLSNPFQLALGISKDNFTASFLTS